MSRDHHDSPSTPLEWTPEFSVGHPLMDQQHRELISIIADARATASVGDLAVALLRMNEYARQHFAAEEALLAGLGYPGLGAQRDAHADYTEVVGSHVVDLDAPNAKEVVCRFLEKWWTKHIMVDDMAYREHIQREQS